MKNFILLSFIINVTSFHSFAQNEPFPAQQPGNNKPHLFDSYAEKITFSVEEISRLFTIPVGSQVETKLDGTFRFAGQVVCNAAKYDNKITSLVIRSSNFSGACLIVSRITAGDGTVLYNGNIISKASGDAYVLKPENGQYTLIKQHTTDVMTD